MNRTGWACAAGVAIALVCVLGGGRNSNAEKNVFAHRVANARDADAAGTLIANRDASSVRDHVSNAICIGGEVNLSQPRGAVEFVARCSGREQANNVGIMFARRVPGHPGRSVGVVAFRRYAKVVTVGPEHGIRRSRCRTRQGFVLCRLDVQAKGHTTLFGRAWIRKKVICSAETSVVASESQGENIRSAQLFNGIPKGC